MTVVESEFNWQDSIAVPAQAPIAVYVVSDFAEVMVRQRNADGTPDSVIVVARENCLSLCASILRECGEHRFRIVQLPDDVIIGVDGNHMHIPKEMREKFDNL